MTNSKKLLIAGWVCFILGLLLLMEMLSGFPDVSTSFSSWSLILLPLGFILLLIGFKGIMNKVIIVCVFVFIVVGFLLATSEPKPGRNAATQANIASLKAQAELFWDESKSYGNESNSCEKKNSIFGDEQIANLVKGAEKSSGNEAVCFSNPKEWATSIELRSTGYFCADSTGFSGNVIGNITSPSCASVKIETSRQ